MTTAVKIAQLGVGYWGPNLLRNLVAHKACEVVKVVDISPKRRAYVEQNYPQLLTVENPDDVFLDPAIAAVVLATPAHTHFSLALKALESGKHVLVEKPMASTVAEVEQLGFVARERGLVAMAGHTFVFSPAVRYLKKLVDSGDLGQVRYVYSRRLNLGRIRPDVDALLNFGPHDVSILQYLFGDPTPLSVTRCGGDYVQRGIDDVVFLTIVYPNKVIANIHVSWLDPERVRKIVIVGSERMAVYDDCSERKIAIHDKGIDRMAVLGEHMDYDVPHAVQFNHRSGDVMYPQIETDEPLKLEITHFIDCICSGADCMTGTAHAAKVLKILSSAKSLRPTQVMAPK